VTNAQVAPKRRFRRRTVRVRVDYDVDGAPHHDWATTLGAGGIFIETETPPPVGQRLKLKFRLPDGQVPHEIEGRVAWAMRASAAQGDPAPSPGMGIEFTDAVACAALARELERTPDLAP
jgi:uncharacterized protein (TIGR02266 family)